MREVQRFTLRGFVRTGRKNLLIRGNKNSSNEFRSDRDPYAIVAPPSTGIVWPVM
jgi:hypothetical protein